jgi:streptogramin lyase
MRVRALVLAISILSAALVFAAPTMAAPPEAPEVTVESPVNINEANLHGVLNPKKAGEPGEYQFLYKESTTLECKGGSAAPVPPGGAAGGEHEEPSQTLTGLAPNTEYAVCLREENLLGGESTVSPAVSFKTAEATAPVIETQSVSEQTGTVTFSATIDPGGAATTCEVQYGETEALEATPVACPTTLPAADTGQAVTVELKGLARKTQYHFKFVAGNEKGTTPASTQGTFKTGPNPPSVVSDPASEVKRATAVLNGYVRPYESEKTIYYFEYGTGSCSGISETCGTKTPTRGPITEEETVEPLNLTRLKPGTTYHFWLVASGAGGTAHGEEETFTTAVAEPKEYLFEKDFAAGSPRGVAVNQTTGDVYVSDIGTHTIEQFNAEGVLQSSIKAPGASNAAFWQLAINNTGGTEQGDVYAVDETGDVVYKFDPNPEGELELDKVTPTIGGPGVGEGSLNEPAGVAIDPSGNVYVANSGSGSVSEFSPLGTVLKENLITGFTVPFGLAIDGDGNIYVAGVSGTIEYKANGECFETCGQIDPNFDTGVAVDSAGNIFVSLNAGTVMEYGPGPGHPAIENLELERGGVFQGHPTYLAVNNTNHDLYVAENPGSVRVFKFVAFTPVTVRTDPATQISGPVEALRGTVNPGGQEPAEYYFEYGLSPCLPETCGTVATEPSQVPLTGDEEIPVSVRLDNLAPNTTYHYRIVGVNQESGLEYGEEQTFTTGSPIPPPPAPPSEGSAPTSSAPANSPIYPLLTSIVPVPLPKVHVPPITRAQHLAKALAACNRKPKRQRAACRRQARRTYGSATKGVAKKKRRK